MGNVEFLRPEFFLATLLAVPVFFLVLREARFGRYFRVGKSSIEGEGSKRSVFFLAVAQSFFAALAVIAIALVLADPRYPFMREVERKEGTDIVFVLDISKSMLAEDLLPNRIEVAKKIIADFVSKREGDRFGLVIFAGKPFLLSPLTSDLEAYSVILSKVTTDSVRQEIPGLSGTNIGEGLLLASESLSWAIWDKNVVLVTDGEANVGVDPKPVAKLLQEKGVKVHSVGIGDPNGIDLFITDKRTGEKHYFLWPDGKPIRAIVDAELMAFVSTTTSGIFANARDQKGLETIFEALDRATKKASLVETVKRYSDASEPFALIAVLSLICYILLARAVSDDPSLVPLRPLRLAESSGNYRINRKRRIFRRTAFAFAIVSLMATLSSISVNLKTNVTPKDVIFVLDVSRSMDTVDPLEKTSRLERAKSFVSWAISKYPQNRHSLVIFSNEAYEVVPSTSDSKTFSYLLSGISSRYAKTAGTDIQNALRLVSRKLSEKRKVDTGTPAPETLVVFLSDGGDNEDTPKTSELRAIYGKSERIAITLSVTFGSLDGSIIPAGIDVFGTIIPVTDSQGNSVISKANHETAKRLAESTNGESVWEKDARKVFESSLAKIAVNEDSIEKNADSTEVSPFWLLTLIASFAAFAVQDKIPLWIKKPSLSVR